MSAVATLVSRLEQAAGSYPELWELLTEAAAVIEAKHAAQTILARATPSPDACAPGAEGEPLCVPGQPASGCSHRWLRIDQTAWIRCAFCNARVREAQPSQRPGAQPEAGVCVWHLDDADDSEMWETSCGHAFQFNNDGPAENQARFCCYCGKPLEESLTRVSPAATTGLRSATSTSSRARQPARAGSCGTRARKRVT